MKKKVLIITYYWPPAGGVAVQRWFKHVKYLRDFGYEPIIVTAENADYPTHDKTLAAQLPEDIEIIKVPIWEPYTIYRKFTGRKKKEQLHSGFIDENKKSSLTQRLSVFIRSNFFIPDARMTWIKPTVNYLSKYLIEHPVDAIISNGTPHSCHVIGLQLKKKFPTIPWIADFRDPWTKIDYFEHLKLTNWALNKHKRLEKEVVQTADRVVTVSWHWKEEFEEISGKNNAVTINNGYDESDFLANPPRQLDKKFTICHTGLMGKDRTVPIFWEVLAELVRTNPEFKQDLQVELIGSVDFEVMQLVHQYELGDYLIRKDFLPHSEVIQRIQEVPLLLLVINDSKDVLGRLPSKLYEYLGAKRPIIAIGPQNGDAAKIILETSSGGYFLSTEKEKFGIYIANAYSQFKAGRLQVDIKDISTYSRRNLTKRYAALLDEVTS